MRRLLPTSLAGQLAALLIGGLLAAHLLGLALLVGERVETGRRAVRAEAIDRLVPLVSLLNEAPPELRDRIATLIASPRFRLRIEADTDVPPAPSSGVEADLVDRLGDALGDSPAPPRVQVVALPDPAHGRDPPHRRLSAEIHVAVPLADGSWLNGTLPVRPPAFRPSWPWLLSLVVSTAIVLASVLLVARRLTRPLSSLADAAERVGRGESVEAIPSQGPFEVRSTIDAFNTMQARLSRFVGERTRMLAAVSHDLRTPITSLRLRAELVDNDDLRRGIVDTLEEMQAMVSATLAFARDDAAGEETRSVDLAALVEGLVDDFAMQGADARFEGPERLVRRCRPNALRRALRNLVENALRYGERARVALSDEGGAAVVRIDDDGPGIPEDELGAVFQPFARLETSRSRDTGGAGLGLAIVRDIVRAHGGEVTLRNRPGGGLSAFVTLP